jgi:calcineurin-like phosphoesterase family protein
MKYFISDTHWGEDRIGINNKPNLFYRPFSSIEEQDQHMYNEIVKVFKDGDELICLGDVIYNFETGLEYLQKLRNKFKNSKFILIIGNYDENHLDILKDYFDEMHHELILNINEINFYLNHYPIKCKNNYLFSITGHIHGLWKVQKNMINVGVDAWHFKPVSEKELLFTVTACEKYYDENVFPY